MIPVIGAVLSQTKRILEKILRIDTDLTTGRATNLDTLDINPLSSVLDATVSSRLPASASPGGSIPTDVQSGLTTQGYTTGRAPNLDNLDTTVSSRKKPFRTLTRVTFTGATGTVLSVAGPGTLHGIGANIIASNNTIDVLIDGATICSETYSGGAIDHYSMTGFGIMAATETPGGVWTGVGGIGWEFQSSLQINLSGPQSHTLYIVYSLGV